MKKILITLCVLFLSILVLSSCDLFKLGGGFYAVGNPTTKENPPQLTTTNNAVSTTPTQGEVEPTTTTTVQDGSKTTTTTTTTTNSGGSSVTSKPTKLAAPEMEWHGDDYTWKAVAHADYYYFHYGSDKVKVTGLTYTFNPKVDFNGKVYVTACSNNPLYLESDESNFIWISVLA